MHSSVWVFLYVTVYIFVVVVQSLSCVWLFVTPWTAAYQASLSFTVSQSLLKLLSIESMMPSNDLILCHPPSPPALNLSQHHGLFQWVNSLCLTAKVLKLQLQHQSFQYWAKHGFILMSPTLTCYHMDHSSLIPLLIHNLPLQHCKTWVLPST